MSTLRRHPRRTAACGVFLALTVLLPAAEATKSAPLLTFSSDVRLRYEWDWDSRTASGAARTDRDRARYRLRLNAGHKLSDTWSLGLRARTGNPDSQQSPHLTFHSSDDATDDFKVSLDRYFLQFKGDGVSGWLGRNTTPFWQQNEMFWDEDVTPTGAAMTLDRPWAEGRLATTAGVFALPDGAEAHSGHLLGAQLKYGASHGAEQFTLAAGLYNLRGEGGAKNLRNRNGARDYLIGVLSGQWSAPVAGDRPLTLGIDLIRNFENYSAADTRPFAARHADETGGWVLSALYGQLKAPRDWQVGWFYARIETLAVNAAYSQDDWARFGSAMQSDVTDFKGHEFRGTFVITKNLNVQARLFLVEALTSVQDGKRLRLDVNWRF